MKIIALILAIMCGFLPIRMTVLSCDDGLVVVKDKCGNMWDFYGDGYAEGETITVLMRNYCIEGVI